jgi:Na+/H+-dicarboxylate symporter
MNEVKVSQKELLTLVDVKRRRAEKLGRFLRDNAFILTILLSILVGFGVGIGLKTGLNERDRNAVIPWFTLPGQLFMRALELLVVPMVFVSVTCATGSLSPRNNLRVTVISLGLVLLTHVASVLTGLAGGLILTACSSPPVKTSLITNKLYEKQKETYDIAADLLRNLIPKNIIKAATSQEVTRYYFSNVNGTVKFTRKIEYTDGANILGILSFAILLGLASSVLEERAALFRQLFKSCNDVILLALRWLIKIVPLGIASLIVQAVFEVQDVAASLAKIALFTGVCLACLVFYGGGVLALILFAFTRANPFKFYLSFVEPAMIAFCSTSEAVCIQKCMDICEEKIGIDPRLAKFSIPFYVALQKSGMIFFFFVILTLFIVLNLKESSLGEIQKEKSEKQTKN